MGDVTKAKYAITYFYILRAVPGTYFIGGPRNTCTNYGVQPPISNPLVLCTLCKCTHTWFDYNEALFAYTQRSGSVLRPSVAYRAKKPLHTGVRTGCHYLISLFVCVYV